jgi:hypothetical protein
MRWPKINVGVNLDTKTINLEAIFENGAVATLTYPAGETIYA